MRAHIHTLISLNFRCLLLVGLFAFLATFRRLAAEKKEVFATFETKEDRDTVKANGINLAGQHDVGMSLHVPGHLMDNLVALNGVGYSIKQRHKDVKRSVKFDEQRQDLYLDICVAGRWRRISPAEAKQALKDVPSASSVAGLSISAVELAELIKDKSSDQQENSPVVVPEDGMET